MRRFMAAALCGIALLAAGTAGCQDTEDPGGEATATSSPDPTDFGSPMQDPDLCDLLGSDAVDRLAAEYGYDPGGAEQTDPGTCAQYPTRFEGEVEKETITVLSTADVWAAAQDAETAFRYWNDADANSYRLRLPFPEAEERSDLAGTWDEAVMVADAEWDHGPQFKVMARAGSVIVFYHITLSLKGSAELCSEALTASCVIPPETIATWIESDLLPGVLQDLAEAGMVDR